MFHTKPKPQFQFSLFSDWLFLKLKNLAKQSLYLGKKEIKLRTISRISLETLIYAYIRGSEHRGRAIRTDNVQKDTVVRNDTVI